jgi:LemA protein
MNRAGKLSKGMKWSIGIGIFVLLFLMFFVGKYNSFISLEQGVDSKWSDVENQYQRQADLIPNLVSVVSSSVSAETSFVKDVTDARTAWANAGTQLAKDRAGTQMNNGISAFVNAVAENYPVLQANKQYIALTDELSGTQNRIANSRREYINAIQSYNTAIKRFPGNMIAGMFGFSEREYYTAEQGALDTPTLGTGQLP